MLSFKQFLLESKKTSRIQRYSMNTKGRDFVVGDIHGAFNHLLTELASVNFDYGKDRLF